MNDGKNDPYKVPRKDLIIYPNEFYMLVPLIGVLVFLFGHEMLSQFEHVMTLPEYHWLVIWLLLMK